MPRPKGDPDEWSVRMNFTMSRDEARLIRRLAELVTTPGIPPNASLAVRVAVREALERRAQEPE